MNTDPPTTVLKMLTLKSPCWQLELHLLDFSDEKTSIMGFLNVNWLKMAHSDEVVLRLLQDIFAALARHFSQTKSPPQALITV